MNVSKSSWHLSVGTAASFAGAAKSVEFFLVIAVLSTLRICSIGILCESESTRATELFSKDRLLIGSHTEPQVSQSPLF